VGHVDADHHQVLEGRFGVPLKNVASSFKIEQEVRPTLVQGLEQDLIKVLG